MEDEDLSNLINPALVKVIEEIVARRVSEELEARAQLVTVDQFTQAMERIDKRFEESDRRFEALQVDINRRFEESDRRFARLEEGQDELRGQMREALGKLDDINSHLGGPFEQFARNVVSRILAGEGTPDVQLDKIHLADLAQTVTPGTTDVEIDGLSLDPPVIIEVTGILQEREKVDRFLRKKMLAEANYHMSFRGFFVASGCSLTPAEVAEVTVDLRQQNCELINL
ncbi:MAG TPA: hypothetical protein VKK79_21865 [Candidatus Lokiarchaeia archaeon]|nr:hypothetical protein [Candidatus Lokiarchaeia archaeon]